MPKTVLGKWTVGSIIAFFVFFASLVLLAVSGEKGGDTLFDNPRLAFAGIFAALSALAAFFTGIFSIIKSRERSPVVFVSTAIGFLVLLFLLGEFLFPH
jgi:hypothetical protein